MNLILINGNQRSGKDYFAEVMKKELEDQNKTCKIISFADPAKEILCKTFGITLDELDDYKNNNTEIVLPNNTKINFRQIIQQFATDAMQTVFSKNIWVNKLVSSAYETDVDFVLVPDFRFTQEAISGFTLHILNSDIVNKDEHISENDLNGFDYDYVIDNTGQPNLNAKAKKYINYVLSDGTVPASMIL